MNLDQLIKSQLLYRVELWGAKQNALLRRAALSEARYSEAWSHYKIIFAQNQIGAYNFRVMKAIGRLRILLGILQESHYHAALFRAWVGRHPRPADWDKFAGKVQVVWSLKVKTLFTLSITFSRLMPWALVWNLRLLRPAERIATRWVYARAALRMQKFKFRAVIGITGSFGKTTTKEVLAAMLAPKFHVHKTPENVNTLLGVARWILREPFQDGDVVIVEMGAYRKGDIDRLCDLAQPTIGILTGLNEAHRERFGSLEATAAAKCELFNALPRGGVALWNADSALLADAVARRRVIWESAGIKLVPYRRNGNPDWRVSCRVAGETDLEIAFAPEGQPADITKDTIRFLGAHLALPLSAALYIAGMLGISGADMALALKKIRPLDRRLNPGYAAGNRLLIDDSYNITLDGVGAALEALKRIERRKIGVFAGIPEGGGASEKINRELGRMIGAAFSVILLRETPVYHAVRKGLVESGFPEANILRYSEGKDVEALLGRVVKDGDCVYFSAYDWPAIYL